METVNRIRERSYRTLFQAMVPYTYPAAVNVAGRVGDMNILVLYFVVSRLRERVFGVLQVMNLAITGFL